MVGNFLIKNEQDSIKFAQQLATTICPNDILTFTGVIGAGKSFMCRHIIRYLTNSTINVISPTFNLLQIYDLPTCQIYHYDLYRLDSLAELYELDIETAFTNNICLIEWPAIINPILPADATHVNIEIIDHNQRSISISTGLME